MNEQWSSQEQIMPHACSRARAHLFDPSCAHRGQGGRGGHRCCELPRGFLVRPPAEGGREGVREGGRE